MRFWVENLLHLPRKARREYICILFLVYRTREKCLKWLNPNFFQKTAFYLKKKFHEKDMILGQVLNYIPKMLHEPVTTPGDCFVILSKANIYNSKIWKPKKIIKKDVFSFTWCLKALFLFIYKFWWVWMFCG